MPARKWALSLFTEKFLIFRMRSWMEQKFSEIKFRNSGFTSRGCPNVPENRNNWKIPFHLAIPTRASVFEVGFQFEAMSQSPSSLFIAHTQTILADLFLPSTEARKVKKYAFTWNLMVNLFMQRPPFSLIHINKANLNPSRLNVFKSDRFQSVGRLVWMHPRQFFQRLEDVRKTRL